MDKKVQDRCHDMDFMMRHAVCYSLIIMRAAFDDQVDSTVGEPLENGTMFEMITDNVERVPNSLMIR